MKKKRTIFLFIIVLITLFCFLWVSHSPAQNNPSSSDNWHKQTFRKLFFDYHSHSSTYDLARDFNAEQWAEQLKQANVEGVSMFAKCGQGWRYYLKGNVGWVHPQMPPNIDMLGEVVASCHKRGIKVIAYYHTFNSEKLAELHPDWIVRNSKNESRGSGLCLLSPLLEEHMIPQVKEIVQNYDIEGIFFDGTYAHVCYCQYCRERFKKESGFDIPDSDKDAHWREYVQWNNRAYLEVRQKIMDAVSAIKKNVLVSFNWVYTPRQPEVLPDDIGSLMCDIFPNDQLFSGSYLSKYWVTLGKPFDIMNSSFLRWWGDWGMKPAAALMQECATIIANGGKTWIGYQMYPRFSVEPAVMNEFGKTMQFIQEREEWSRDAEPVPYIAVLHSTNSYFTHKTSLQVDERPLQSVHKMLLQSGFHFNIVNEQTLLETIGKYKVVILPDQRGIDAALTDALRTFVRNGGGLVATLLTGTEDASFKSMENFNIADVLGVKLDGTYPQSHAYFVVKDERLKNNVLNMPQQVFGEFTLVKPTTALALADFWDIYLRGDGEFLLSSSPPGKYTGRPAITVNQFGKGKAAYICGDIFGAYIERNQWNLKNLLKNIINIVVPEKLVEIEAPDVVEVVLTKKRNKPLIHLINHSGERPLGENIAFTEDIIPVYDIIARVKFDGLPKSVKLMPENKELHWYVQEGKVTIKIPELKIYSIVVIE